MWNAPNHPIPESQIRAEHLRVLRSAIHLDEPNTSQVLEALQYLEARSLRTGGFSAFRRWLAHGGDDRFHDAMNAINRHLGN